MILRFVCDTLHLILDLSIFYIVFACCKIYLSSILHDILRILWRLSQVATFAPIDLAWIKQTMHPSEPKINTSDDSYDYRKSGLPAGNEYLPPV